MSNIREQGAAIAQRAIARVEALQSGVSECLINAVARKHRVSPYHIALRVPGVCHDHTPTTRLIDGCAYCRRRGNVLADPATASQATASQATANQATASQATASQATANQATASQATASQACGH